MTFFKSGRIATYSFRCLISFIRVPLLCVYRLTPIHESSNNSYWRDATFRHWSMYIFYPYTMDFTRPPSCLVSFAAQPRKHAVILFFVLCESSATHGIYCVISPHCREPGRLHSLRISSSFSIVNLLVLWLWFSAPSYPCTGSQQWGLPGCTLLLYPEKC